MRRNTMFSGERKFVANSRTYKVRTDDRGVWVKELGSRGDWRILDWFEIASHAIPSISAPAAIEQARAAKARREELSELVRAFRVGQPVRIKKNAERGARGQDGVVHRIYRGQAQVTVTSDGTFAGWTAWYNADEIEPRADQEAASP